MPGIGAPPVVPRAAADNADGVFPVAASAMVGIVPAMAAPAMVGMVPPVADVPRAALAMAIPECQTRRGEDQRQNRPGHNRPEIREIACLVHMTSYPNLRFTRSSVVCILGRIALPKA